MTVGVLWVIILRFIQLIRNQVQGCSLNPNETGKIWLSIFCNSELLKLAVEVQSDSENELSKLKYFA